MPFTRRKILLSLRERPLPVLWLLAFLTPYLLFSLSAVPHFHSSDFAGFATTQHLGSDCSDAAVHQDSHASSSHALHGATECPLCQWTSSSHSGLFTPQQIELEEHVSPSTVVTSNRFAAPHVSVFDSRGPPLSL